MTLSLKHAFQSAKADGSDTTLVQPSNWNEEHEAVMATSRILGRLTAGSGAIEELTPADVTDLLGIEAGLDSGTKMLFQQTAAPTGWTKQTTHNDKALRVVSGTPGTGGTSPFSTVFGLTATQSHVITTGELPSHSHSISLSGTTGTQSAGHTHSFSDSFTTDAVAAHSHSYTAPSGSNTAASGTQRNIVTGTTGATTGSGGSHSHSGSVSGTTGNVSADHTHSFSASGTSGSQGSGTGHTHSIEMRVQYVDLIIAAKD